MKQLLACLMMSAISACASIHEGRMAESLDAKDKESAPLGIVISGQENADLSSTYFTEVDFTFENRTSDWVRVKNVTLDFGDKATNEEIQIPVGADLYAWAKAAEQNKMINDYNERVVLGSILAVGTAAAAFSHDSSVRQAGLVAGLGGLNMLAVSDLGDERRRIELAKVVPENHLMSPSFVIPPALHSKRWVTLYTKHLHMSPQVHSVILKYTLENGKTERVQLKFRSENSSWHF